MLDKTESFRVLVADDDPSVHEALKEVFDGDNLCLLSANDGEQAICMLKSEMPDILVTDIMMPKMDGLELLRTIRENSDMPVIILSARGEEFDRLLGLQLGADDYITKPFSAKEVAARIRIILRRLLPSRTEENKLILKIGNLIIDKQAYNVKLDNKSISCTSKELEILWTLATNQNIVITRKQLLQTVWGYDYKGDLRAVDSHIKRIRAKLYREENNWDIQTVWGVGYRFEVKR